MSVINDKYVVSMGVTGYFPTTSNIQIITHSTSSSIILHSCIPFVFRNRICIYIYHLSDCISESNKVNTNKNERLKSALLQT